MVSTLRSGKERAEGGAAETGGNNHGGASGAEIMASLEDTFGPEAQRTVQIGAERGARGSVNPRRFGDGSSLTKLGAKDFVRRKHTTR